MKIKKLKKIGECHTLDVEVDSTSTYQLENGIVSHNTSGLLLGTSSGIHAWHNDYYIRRIRVGKSEPLYHYIKQDLPDLVEDCVFKPHLESVLSIPQKAPEGAILRSESSIATLNRVKKFNKEWIGSGHREGINQHNVSCTISVRNRDWDRVKEWMWKNRDSWTGITILPYNDHNYPQAPYEDCTEDIYNSMMEKIKDIDLKKVIENEDNTNLTDQAACSGAGCEIF